MAPSPRGTPHWIFSGLPLFHSPPFATLPAFFGHSFPLLPKRDILLRYQMIVRSLSVSPSAFFVPAFLRVAKPPVFRGSLSPSSSRFKVRRFVFFSTRLLLHMDKYTKYPSSPRALLAYLPPTNLFLRTTIDFLDGGTYFPLLPLPFRDLNSPG